MTEHMFVDESKKGGFLMVAACFVQGDLERSRKVLRDLLQPGQERLHFTKERDARRRAILAALSSTDITGIVITTPPTMNPAQARGACLERLAQVAVQRGVVRIAIEQDDSVVTFDRRTLFAALRREAPGGGVSYVWLRAKQEPLLWAADAIAWSWAKGGLWRAFVQPMVELHALKGS